MRSALRSLLIMLGLMQASHAGFLTDGNGNYLLDTFGGKIMISDGVHELNFNSKWGTGQLVLAWFDVKADKSGIIVWGEGKDASSPVVETEIVRVLPGYTPADCPLRCVSLVKCPSARCDVDWATSDMPAQNNQILFYMTNAAGGRYGAATNLSRPQ